VRDTLAPDLPPRTLSTSPAPSPDAATAEPSHRELVERIRAGDRKAEERLVELFARPVSQLLARQTNRRPEAEDLFQETFRLALDKLRRGELREPDRLPGFLAGLARNLAIDHYRAIHRRRTDTGIEHLEALPATKPSALHKVLDAEKVRRVRQLLGELNVPRDREVLFRFYLGEEDRETIAADLGVDVLQLNRILHRARQRYKELAEKPGLRLALFLGAISGLLSSLTLAGGM
jgi:RNA polymerase sigma-70 factor (ECF subfamily)